MRYLYTFFLAVALLMPVQVDAAFAVSRTVSGFRLKHFMNGGISRPVEYPAVAAEVFVVGQVIVLEAGGLATGAAAGATNVIGVSLENITIPGASDDSDDHRLLVETNLRDAVWAVNWDAAAEILDDGDVGAVTTGGGSLSFGTSLTSAADDVINGHAILCYAGSCIGQWRVILDYDDADGVAHGLGDQLVYLNRPFDPTADTSSSCIIVGTGTADQGILPGHNVDLGGTSALKISGDDYAGPLLVVGFDEAPFGIVYVQIVDTAYAAP